MYIPKPVVNGSIPKNAFGNLDLYVSSMIPPGSVHIRALETAKAAKLLSIDYADAVTGFKFQGRKGTAIVDGAIVATEYQVAVQETILGLRWQAELAEAQKREKEALRMWKKFLVGLRIRERIMGYEVEGEKDDKAVDKEAKDEMDKIDQDESNAKVEAGGFMPDADQGPIAQPTNGKDAKNVELDVPDFDINNFPDASFIKSRTAYDAPLVVELSPWDKGGPLHHLNPYKAAEVPKTVPSVQVEPRRKPTLPRTQTPGLFLSPTRDDAELESGGGFFGDGKSDEMEASDALADAKNNGSTAMPQVARVETADEELDGLFNEADDLPPAVVQADVTHEDEGGGFVVEDSIPSTTPQDTKMSGAIGEGDEEDNSGTVAATNGDHAINGDRPKETIKINHEDEDTAEATETSMLSHDEEDDDAEPDWLVDEIGW